MTSVADEAAEQQRTLRDFAALSGVFDPGPALVLVQEPSRDPARLVSLSAGLARLCDTRPAPGTSVWLMRGPERRWALDGLVDEGRLSERVAWRRDLAGSDGDTGLLLDALLGQGRCSADAITRALDAGSWAELSSVAVALERAGPPAPAFGQLDAVRAALTRFDPAEGGGLRVEGRDHELAEIARWLDAQATAAPVRALFVGGAPGLGKSALLDAAVRAARSSPRGWIVVRLDFERRGLDVQDLTGLTVELARQVAGALTADATVLRQARLAAASATLPDLSPRLKGTGADGLPVALARVLAGQVRDAARPVLVVLDTLEVVRGRGETHPGRLFAWLDALVVLGVHPLAVLAAGRADALDGVPERVGGRIDLPGLDEASADRVLAALEVPLRPARVVRRLAQGSPLVLRLGPPLLAVVQARATGAAPTAAAGRPDAGRSLRRLTAMTVRGAALHLVVRRIDAAVITEVLAPHLGLDDLDPDGAAELLEQLAGQTWLVEPDTVAPGLRYRPEVRRVLLRRVHEHRPDEAADVDRAAAAWYAARPEPWAAVEAAYHRLQGMRRTGRAPAVQAAVLRRFDAETIADLPPRAQDVVRRARGERSSLVRTGPPGRAPSAQAAAELSAIVERGDWLEGGYVYDRAFLDRPFDARSAAGDAALAFLWRSGQWVQARRLLDRRDRTGRPGPVDEDLATLPPHLAAVRVEMRAELTSATFVRALARDPRLAGLATDLAHSGLRSDLSEGALGFALRRAGLVHRASPWRELDRIDAAWETWLSPPAGSPGPALAGARERLARRLGQDLPPRDDPAATALLLSALSPYADTAVTLGRVRGDPRLEQHAAAVSAHLASASLVSAQPVTAAQPVEQPLEPVGSLASLGLFAEWAGAAAFLLRDPDLRLLADSAERWRRTAAGQWSYDAPTGDVTGWGRPLDLTLADRLLVLSSATDPPAAGRAQLAAWSGAQRPGAPAAEVRIARRLRGTLALARDAVPRGATAVAEVLVGRRVPAAFVPAMSVLLVHGELEDGSTR